MLVLSLDLGMLARLAIGYGLGAFMVVTGAHHTYWAWTGQTDRLTTVVEGALAESPATRRRLWAVLGPFVVLGGLGLLGVLTWLLVGQ
jgi:hypothetical protein